MVKINPKLTIGEVSQICRDKGACAGCQFFDGKELECALNEVPPEDFEFDTDSQEER